jgi:hypothetical protein
MIFVCGSVVNGYTAGHNDGDSARVCALHNLGMRNDGVDLETIGVLLHPELADATTERILAAAECARAKFLAARPGMTTEDLDRICS